MKDLKEVREKIDEIDSRLVPLFEQRMKAAVEVAECKKRENSKEVYRAEREQQVLDKAVSMLADSTFADETRRFMSSVMDISKDVQKGILLDKAVRPDSRPVDKNGKVCFFGDEGSYSEQAAIYFFGEKGKRVAGSTFRDVFEKLRSGEADYGVVPIENSSTGSINDVYDLLGEYDFFIVAERWMRIRQQLAGVGNASLSDVKEVYSHPQGLKQCADYFSSYPQIKLIPCGNTAQAAAYVAGCADKSKAAICGTRAAQMNNLQILAADINTQSDNYTRFIVISRYLKQGDCNKISVMFTLANTPGTLFGALRYLAIHRVNMTKLESRPQKNSPGNYIFYVDISGCAQEAEEALRLLRSDCRYYKLLGEYERCEINE